MDESQRNKIIDGLISVKELIEYMKSDGLVLIKRDEWQQEAFKEKCLEQKSLTFSQIAKSGLWNVKTRSGVEHITKKEVEEHEYFRKGNKILVHISAVVRIAKNRGTI